MTLLLIEARGWRPIGAHLRVRFSHIPHDCTVAIVGPNGVGKSTLLKLLGWAEHGDALMGRGWANEMRLPSSAEATVVVWQRLDDGRLLKIRKRVAKKGKVIDTDVFIDAFPADSELVEQGEWIEATGTPETLCSGLVSTAPDVLKALGVIPTALYQAAGAADQGGAGSFFNLPKLADRRDVIGAACGTDNLAPLAAIGKAQHPAIKRVVEHLTSRVEVLSAKRADLATVDAALATGETALAAALLADKGAAGRLAEAEDRCRLATDKESLAKATLTAAQSRAADLTLVLAATRRDREALSEARDEEPLSEMRTRLAKAREIRDRQLQAKATHEGVQLRLTQAAADLSTVQSQRAAFGFVRSRSVLTAEVDTESPLAARLPELLQAAEVAKEGGAAAMAAFTPLVDAPAALARAEAAAKETTEKRERLNRQGAYVEQVPCRGGKLTRFEAHGHQEVDCGTCPALVDAREAKDAVPSAKAAASEAAAILSEATRRKQAHDAAAERVKTTSTAFAQAQTQVALAQAAKTRLDKALRELEQVERVEQADAAVERAKGIYADVAAEGAAVVETGRRLRSELAEILRVPEASAKADAIEALELAVEARATAAVDGGAAQIATLDARLAELRGQVAAAQRAVTDAESACAVAKAEADDARGIAAEARAEGARLAAAATAARLEVAKLQGSREPLARDVAALPALEAALADARTELDDYALIEQGFGPRGVPGLVIDAEGGRLAEDMQESLDMVYGERAWEVEFRTFDPTAAKTLQELADLFVRGPADTEWRNATDVSGGEGKMLDQAFRGAMRRMIARRTGYAFSRVHHDEQDTGLDLAKQREYVSVVRATGPARHLIVSHNAQVQAACDYRLCLDKDGSASWE